jgi:hypothetical protein
MTTDALTVGSETPGFVRFANLAAAQTFAEYIAKSEMVPKDYRGKPADIVIAMQMGIELGFSPLQALQAIAVIGGRPAVWGDGIPALIIPHRECEQFDEQEPEGVDPTKWVAVCTITRRGKNPVVRTFSTEDAKKAGLWGKTGPWTTHPKRMLQLKARAFAARDSFPDVLKGVSIAEDVQEIPAETARITAPRRLESAVVEPVADATPETPPTVTGDMVASQLFVNDYVCLKDERGLYYRITTNDGVFYTRDEAVAAPLMQIQGEERTFTATYRHAKAESGEGVRALVKVAVDPEAAVEA